MISNHAVTSNLWSTELCGSYTPLNCETRETDVFPMQKTNSSSHIPFHYNQTYWQHGIFHHRHLYLRGKHFLNLSLHEHPLPNQQYPQHLRRLELYWKKSKLDLGLLIVKKKWTQDKNLTSSKIVSFGHLFVNGSSHNPEYKSQSSFGGTALFSTISTRSIHL